MAKKQPTEDKSSGKSKKRQLRLATTVREQSQRATARAEKPSRKGKVGRILGAPFRGLGKLFRPLGKIKFFRVLGLILWPKYFRNSVRELRMVTWPNRKQTLRLTIAVIIFSVIFGVLIAIVDYGLDKLFKKVILNQ